MPACLQGIFLISKISGKGYIQSCFGYKMKVFPFFYIMQAGQDNLGRKFRWQDFVV